MEQKFERIARHFYKRQYQTATGDWSTYYYGIFVDCKKKRRTFPLGSDLRTAKDELKVYEARNIRREDFDQDKEQRSKEQGMTFSQWTERYLDLVRKKTSLQRDKQLCNHLIGFFGDLPLLQITRSKIMEYKNLRLESPIIRHGKPVEGSKLTVSSVNRELSCLRHILHLAADEGLIESVPRIKLESERHLARDRVLSEEEEHLLLDKSPRWLQRVIIGAVETSMDRSDIIRLTKGEVNRKEGLIMLRGGRTKTGVKAIIPILPRLESVLDELWEESKKISNVENLVFTEDGKPIAVSRLRKAFERAMVDAEIKDFRFKDLRHSAKTRWAKMGVPVEAAMAAAGHKSVAMHYRYVNLNGEHIREAFKMFTGCLHEKEGHGIKSVSS